MLNMPTAVNRKPTSQAPQHVITMPKAAQTPSKPDPVCSKIVAILLLSFLAVFFLFILYGGAFSGMSVDGHCVDDPEHTVVFISTSAAPNASLSSATPITSDPPSSPYLFDWMLRRMWSERMATGDVFSPGSMGDIIQRSPPGRWGFISQYNHGRGQRRQKPVRPGYLDLIQKVQQGDFNFNKIASKRERLFEFVTDPIGNHSQIVCSGQSVPNREKSLVLVNIFPIDFGHVLLVPLPHLNMSQTPLCEECAMIALRFQQQSLTNTFRVGYNSLGAGASVNHLHFQSWYFESILKREDGSIDHRLPIEKAPMHEYVYSNLPEVTVSVIPNYPITTIVFKGASGSPRLASAISRCASICLDFDVRHNFLISATDEDEGRMQTVFFFVRQPEVDASVFGMKAAFPEFSGIAIFTELSHFESTIDSEDPIVDHFRSLSLPQELFLKVLTKCSHMPERQQEGDSQ